MDSGRFGFSIEVPESSQIVSASHFWVRFRCRRWAPTSNLSYHGEGCKANCRFPWVWNTDDPVQAIDPVLSGLLCFGFPSRNGTGFLLLYIRHNSQPGCPFHPSLHIRVLIVISCTLCKNQYSMTQTVGMIVLGDHVRVYDFEFRSLWFICYLWFGISGLPAFIWWVYPG